ncbi:hypothetical protein T440DRAFT_482735 [Plenodomus tracheiphilus IPT5]|uniref:F-box domain-containing protein n=1 Tax=Plenodomus tracheiphilus IPT5 TaxID=1408161 RepID=A0A6A7AS94_9PLEO|nr:hypothetical protein T440DRAFT_482735 [Plenodomus tracheiphilus IPT5]
MDLHTARATEHDNVASSSFQKSLPGLPEEIRNHIYLFAIEDFQQKFFLSLKRGGREHLCKDCAKDVIKEHPHSIKRLYFGLTQSCRQIRTEYRALYLARTQVRIYSCDLDEYMKTFVDVNPSLSGKCEYGMDEEYQWMVKPLFNIIKYPKLNGYFEKAAWRVPLTYTSTWRRAYGLRMHIRPSEAEMWQTRLAEAARDTIDWVTYERRGRKSEHFHEDEAVVLKWASDMSFTDPDDSSAYCVWVCVEDPPQHVLIS